MRAVVIDDSRAMRRMISILLIELGYEVAEASNGQEGLETIRDSGPFDLALVDWNMPIMNGFEFVTAARSDSDLKEMRILMATSQTDASQVEKALDAGADEFVMKPFTRDELASKIELVSAARG